MRLEAGTARFDAEHRAWILTTYADVFAALRDARLPASDGASHMAVREAAAQAFSAERLAALQSAIALSARTKIAALPKDVAVDLVHEFAEPWCLELAMMATAAAPADTRRLSSLAREVFLAAASATSSESQPHAREAAAELARHFPGAGASVAVQAFIALSQTLPCFLAGAWLALFQHPEETTLLRTEPELMPQAIEELLRYAGPSRAVFRQAATAVKIGGAEIGVGERVILMLAAANRDPAPFREPDRLDLRRGGAGHLAFGGGPHFCAGASLIRMAAAVAAAALLETADIVECRGETVDWIGGFAIQGPASLTVVLREIPPASD